MPRGDIWSNIETKAFLTTYGKYHHQLQNAKTNNQKETLWDKIASEHTEIYALRNKRACQVTLRRYKLYT